MSTSTGSLPSPLDPEAKGKGDLGSEKVSPADSDVQPTTNIEEQQEKRHL